MSVKKPIIGNTYYMIVIENGKEKWQEVVYVGLSFNRKPIVTWYGLTKIVSVYDLYLTPSW